MATMRREIWIERPAADVWSVVGDPVSVTSWFPQMAAVKMEGDQRTITLASGLDLIERVAVRHDLRRFQYRLDGPLTIDRHQASIDVIADGTDRCLVVYSTDVVPHALALVLDGAIHDALRCLKQLMETS